jgi:hypothetical protein
MEVVILRTIIFGVILAIPFFVREVMGTVFGQITVERAAYDVVRQVSSNMQLRHYRPCVYAETPAGNGGLSSSESSAAFQRLAKYIGVFGTPANEDALAIAMTAPVVRACTTLGCDTRPKKMAMTAPVVNTAGTIAFVLPTEYQSVDMAPRPTDPRVTLRAGRARTCAVLTFGGYATDATVSSRVAELVASLKHEGIRPVYTTQFELLRYNPPFTIPMLRTNEILIEVYT